MDGDDLLNCPHAAASLTHCYIARYRLHNLLDFIAHSLLHHPFAAASLAAATPSSFYIFRFGLLQPLAAASLAATILPAPTIMAFMLTCHCKTL